MGRVVTDVIPHHESWTPAPVNENLEYSKRKRSNDMASHHRRSRHSNVQVGDRVPIWDNFPGSKVQLPFEVRPWTVTRREGSLVVVKKGSEQIAHNILWFKKFQPPLLVPDETTKNDPCSAESNEASEDSRSEGPLPNGDSADSDQEASEPDSGTCHLSRRAGVKC
ncbi:hypothetical protein NDU88_002686 [Pleurodeles waltl]|uniref:Uncharacterized protein n=1 Tax=Pleurodeles waltl TaxID=8319 RepID=A0AAV7RDG4_PLEWA|nr:hypothetical protein NDU88_002686 [Pleurodeles waltl]